MKQTRPLLLLVAVTLLAAGCKEKIELDKVDTSMSVNTGIAAPIVTVKAPLTEILGISDKTGQSSKLNWMYAKLPGMPGYYDEQLKHVPDGALFFRDTFDIMRDFHPIDIGGFLLPVEENLNIFEQAKKMNYSVSGGVITIPAGSPLKFSFPLEVKLDSINTTDKNENPDGNRIDRMRISTARFRTLLSTNFGLKDEDIQSVKIKMPKEFTTFSGKKMSDVYIPSHVEGEYTYVEINKFLIKLLPDNIKENRLSHVTNTVTFNVEFSLFITTHQVTVTAESAINYSFDVELLTYEALYGYFNPSTWMEDQDTVVLAEQWPAWNDIKRMKMHFRYPSIRLIARHQIGTEDGFPLHVNLTHIGVAQTDANGNPGELVMAQFGNGSTTHPNYVWKLDDPDNRIDPNPDNKDMNQWSENQFIVGYEGFMGENTHVGDVDKLFDLRPDIIGYKYDITVGPKSNPAIGSQLRVVNNTIINLQAVTVVPFVLNEGSEVEYADTLDVDFSNVNFDSITNSVEWLESINNGTIYLYLYAKNSIPFKISADYRFLDGNGQTVDLPLIEETEGRKSFHMDIPAPAKYDNSGNVTETGNNTIVLRITHDEISKLQSVRKLASIVSIDANPQHAIIHTQSGLDVTIGVSATIDAVMKIF